MGDRLDAAVVAVLQAITAGVRRIPRAKSKEDQPAAGLSMAIDCSDIQVDLWAIRAMILERYPSAIEEVSKLGYVYICLVGATEENTLMLWERKEAAGG